MPDRLSPYETDNDMSFSNSQIGQLDLATGWKRFDLRKCKIQASQGDKKVFKIIVTEDEKEKEQKFIVANVCSRNIWVKKLKRAKDSLFDDNANDSVRETVFDETNNENLYQTAIEETILFESQIQ